MKTQPTILSILKRKRSEEGAVSFCFFGDSVTQGFFEYKEKGDPYAAYPNQLGMLFSDELSLGINIDNEGIGGNDTEMGLARMERDVIRRKPDICLVAFGANDVWKYKADGFEKNLREIIAKLQEKNIPIMLMTQHHMNKTVKEDVHPELVEVAQKMAVLQNDGTVESLYDVTRKLAKEYQLPLVDIYAKYTEMEKEGIDTDLLLANRINHPIKEMHKKFARWILDVILEEEA